MQQGIPVARKTRKWWLVGRVLGIQTALIDDSIIVARPYEDATREDLIVDRCLQIDRYLVFRKCPEPRKWTK